MLEGQFAYAEPLRLALQNLALGRPASTRSRRRPPCASRCATPTTRRDVGPLTKLENAISKQRTVKFPYYSIGRDKESSAPVNPYALLPSAARGT
jgi:proteasome accessory factor C